MANRHGLSYSRIYRIWVQMKARCNNPKTAHYDRYGGRGIKVCPAWDDFNAFLADLGHPPDKYTLERADNNGPYSPENCHWATRKEQANNTARNIYMTHEGLTMSLMQWSERSGVNYSTVLGRHKLGWPPERVLSPDSQQDYSGLFLGGLTSAYKRKNKPLCKYGHERTPENVVLQIENGKEIRKYCKPCARIRMAAWRKKHKS